MHRQVLFVMGSRACVQEDPLLAARRLGLRSVVFAPRPPRCGAILDLLHHADDIDVRRPEQAVEQARRLHEQAPIGGVLGYEEDATLVAAHIADALGLPAHPIAAAEAAMDKPAMKQRFAAAGVPCADFIVAADEDDAVAWAHRTGYPVVVKPCRGGASQGVIRADDEPALRAAYRRLRRIIRDHHLDNGDRPVPAQLVEQYLPGSEVSVELLLQYGAADVITEFGKPLPLTGPYFEETIYLTPPTLDPQLRNQCHELAIAAAKALGFHHGPAHCEIRLTPDGPKVLEIAGRLLGGACARSFRDRLGHDIHTYLLRSALGEHITIPTPTDDAPTVGALMMPVPGEGRVVAVRGADSARQVPGVWDVTLLAAPGEIVVPFPEQACYAVGFVSASGPDEAAVVRSLSDAAAGISLELAPLRTERWARAVGTYGPKRFGTGAVLRTDWPAGEVIPRLAQALFDELPEAEGLEAAERTVSEVRSRAGVPCWVDIPGTGLFLCHLDGPGGQVAHVVAGGVLPTARRRTTYRSMVAALLDELARRRVSRCEIELDPRLAERADALAGLGFTRQPEPAPAPGATSSLSCALPESTAALVDVVRQYGTPAYAYDLDRVRAQVSRLRSALAEDVEVFYSLKANPLPELSRLLAESGFGAEVASPGELRVAMAAGFPSERILANGPYKHPDVLAVAAAEPGLTLSVDSMSELSQLAEAGRPWRIVLRLRPDFGPAGDLPFGPACRFGIPVAELAEVPALVGESALRLSGFHVYAGSQVTRAEEVVANLRNAFELGVRAAGITGTTPEVIGLGGGFGVPYGPGQPAELDLRPVAAELHRLRALAGPTRLLLELGRYLVAPAGWYLTRVVAEQHCPERTAFVVDGGIHHRPDLCGLDLPRKSYPPLVLPAGRPVGQSVPGQATVDIVGCLCLPWDLLASEVQLPPLRTGDVLAFANSGAYGLTAAPSSFISHPPPVEVVFDRAGGVRKALGDRE